MKRLLTLLLAAVLHTAPLSLKAGAQTAEAEQLLLDVEKLTQLKAILENLYQGYRVLDQGYTAVKDLAEGNFSLHQAFLDGLLQVSPTVKSYYRVAEIITRQARMVKESKAALKRFGSAGSFTAGEIRYLSGVYDHLLRKSAGQLDELLLVLTSGELRMSDEERLQAIDRIYAGVADQLAFVHDFSTRTDLLLRQRIREKAEVDISQKLNGF